MKNNKSDWRLLKKYLLPQWSQLLFLSVLFFMGISLQLLHPQIIRLFMDSATQGKGLGVLRNLAMVFIGVAIAQQLVNIGVTYLSQNLGWKATNNLRTDVLKHCIGLDMTFHKQHRPGDLIERVDGDISLMFNFFSNLLIEVLSHIVLMIGVIIILFLEDWRMGVAMAVFVLLAIYIMMVIQKIAVPRQVAFRKIVTEFYGFLNEVLGNTEDIRANGAEEKTLNKFKGYLAKWLPLNLKAGIASISMWTSTLAIFAMGNAIAFGLGGFLWSKGIITVGTVYLIFHYTELLSMPLRQIQRQMADLQKASASIQRVEELLNTKNKIREGIGVPLKPGPLKVELQKISFGYEESLVLEDLELSMEPGKVLGVVGRTGSGKTTLARLITRLYDVNTGEIKINGVSIASISLANLRESIAYVTQDVQLFNATIRDNLTFFDKGISDNRIWSALETMGLDGWIRSMPNGLDTVIDSDAGGLSAGQAQLLAFVRVFLRNPGLVILDEASSRLDPHTEALMEKAVYHLLKDRTAIIIAHRLQTIDKVDNVLILDKGKALEYGSNLKLRENPNSHFSKLLANGIQEVLA